MRKSALIAKAERAGVDLDVVEQCSHEAGTERLIAAILTRQERPTEFEGEEACNSMPFFVKVLPPFLARVNSIDVQNDPRNFGDSTLNKRYDAFDSIVVGATLLASLACSVCLTVFTGVKLGERWAALCGTTLLTIAFVLNMICLVVITQQKYQVMRLATSGAAGFESAKSYYLNENIVKLRHVGVKCFTVSLSLFTISVGMISFDLLWHYARYFAVIILTITCVAGLIIGLINGLQRKVFMHYYKSAKQLSEPLRQQMDTVNRRNNGRDDLYN
jgi:hypothetical protein